MNNDREFDKDLNILLWGRKGYQHLGDSSPSDFSMEKMLAYLKDKKESTVDDNDL